MKTLEQVSLFNAKLAVVSHPYSCSQRFRDNSSYMWHPKDDFGGALRHECPPDRFVAGDCSDFWVENSSAGDEETAETSESQKRCRGLVGQCTHTGDLSRRLVRLAHATTFVRLKKDHTKPATVVDHRTLKTPEGKLFTVQKPISNYCFSDEANDRRCLPRLVYIDFGHGGSTSLFHALGRHPQLISNLILRNGLRGYETWFFDHMWQNDWSIERGRYLYAGLFPNYLSPEP